MQMQELSITFFWLISCTAVYSGIVEYRVIISNRGALCAYTVKHAPERSTAVLVRERVTSFILILPVSSSAIWKCLLHAAPTSWNLDHSQPLICMLRDILLCSLPIIPTGLLGQ
jgi:hypothetical protein